MKNGKIIDRKDIRKSVYIRWTIIRGWGPIPCASFDRHYLLRSWKMAKSRCPAPGKWKTDPSYDFSASRVGYIPFRLHCRVTIFPEEGGEGWIERLRNTSNSHSCDTKLAVNSEGIAGGSRSLCLEIHSQSQKVVSVFYESSFPPYFSLNFLNQLN